MGKIRKLLRINALILLIFSLIFTSSFSVSGDAYGNKSEKRDKRIALTFDDGPHKKYTEQILDILEKYSVKATFFVVGVCAEEYPQIVAREIADGHEIGNHTYSHIHLKNASGNEIAGEIDRNEKLIMANNGYEMKLFRPPEGVCNDTVRRLTESMNYSLVLWTVDTRDWVPSSKESIVKSVLSSVKGGEIILMHDYVVGISNTPAALEMIIPRLLSEGYTFVTVSELMQD